MKLEQKLWIVLFFLCLIGALIFFTGCTVDSEKVYTREDVEGLIDIVAEQSSLSYELGKQECEIVHECSLVVDNSSVLPVFCPNDFCDDVLVELISSAQESIDVMVFSFTLPEVRHALIGAHGRGVNVRVLMDKQQAGNKYSVHEQLEAYGIPVVLDTSSGYMHNKVMIIDGKIVVTGSFNFSVNARDRNDENYVVINNELVAQEYLNRFEKLWRRDYYGE